jgi:uncharacterized protein YbjT (DUF2867 family)
VARCLIVGCGCRGRALTSELRASGHAVRGTTRQPERLEAIAAAGAEPVLADPDRLATLLPALDQVSVVVLPLGSASGSLELVSALHGPRLAALLGKLIDTPVRGVVYEASGSVDPSVLARGAAQVASMCERSWIAHVLVSAGPADWTEVMGAAVARVLRGD